MLTEIMSVVKEQFQPKHMLMCTEEEKIHHETYHCVHLVIALASLVSWIAFPSFIEKRQRKYARSVNAIIQ